MTWLKQRGKIDVEPLCLRALVNHYRISGTPSVVVYSVIVWVVYVVVAVAVVVVAPGAQPCPYRIGPTTDACKIRRPR